MRMVINEWARILNRRIFWGLLAALFIVNGVLLYSEQSGYEKIGGDLTAYRQAFNEYRGNTSEAKAQEIQEHFSELERFRQIDFYYQSLQSNSPSVLPDDFSEEILDEYETGAYLQYSDNIHTEYAIFKALTSAVNRESEHRDYIRSMEERAESMLSVSLFTKGLSEFEKENIRRTPLDFAAVAEISLPVDISEGVEGFINASLTDLLLVLLLFSLCAFLFLNEENRSLSQITRPTANGRLPYVVSKLIAAGGLAVILTLLFQLGNLLLMNWKYGLGDLSRPIQSVEGFMRCHLPISVGETILLYLAVKVLMMVFASAFLCLLCILLKSGVLTCAVTALAAAVSLICQISISSLSYLNFLRYLNPVNALSVREFIKEYANLNFFSRPVPVLYAVIFLYSVLCIAALLAAMWAYCHTGEGQRKRKPWRFLRFFKTPPFLSGCHTRLVFHEAHKILISQKGILILLALVILQISFWQQNDHPPVVSAEDAVFQSLCANLSGGDSPENDRYIDSVQKRNQELDGKIEKIYASQLPELEKEKQVKNLTMDKIPQNVLIRLEAMQENVKKHQAEYLYDGSYHTFLLYTNHDLERNISACLVLILLLSVVYNCEYSTGMSKLLTASFRGREETFRCKLGLSLGLTLAVYLVSYVPQMLLYVKAFGTPWSHAPLNSIMLLKDVSLGISVTGAILLNYGFKLLGLLLVSSITLWLSCHSYSILSVLVGASAIVLLPQLLSFMGLTPVDWISLNFLLYQSKFLCQVGTLPGIFQPIYYIIFALLLLLLMIWLTAGIRKKWIQT